MRLVSIGIKNSETFFSLSVRFLKKSFGRTCDRGIAYPLMRRIWSKMVLAPSECPFKLQHRQKKESRPKSNTNYSL